LLIVLHMWSTTGKRVLKDLEDDNKRWMFIHTPLYIYTEERGINTTNANMTVNIKKEVYNIDKIL
jgi:hypothetical protein